LPDTISEHRVKGESANAFANGKMAFNDAATVLLDKIKANVSLKPRSKYYRELIIGFIRRSWPAVFETDVRKVSERIVRIGSFLSNSSAIAPNLSSRSPAPKPSSPHTSLISGSLGAVVPGVTEHFRTGAGRRIGEVMTQRGFYFASLDVGPSRYRPQLRLLRPHNSHPK
jgi:hypothetical protein